jgi:hypothetical protein
MATTIFQNNKPFDQNRFVRGQTPIGNGNHVQNMIGREEKMRDKFTQHDLRRMKSRDQFQVKITSI